jgi:hypothetical protein
MRVPLGSLGLWCALACAPVPAAHSPRAVARVRPSLLANTFDGTKAGSQYRLAPARANASRRGGLSDELRLMGGRRLVDSGGSVQLADTVASADLADGRELPGFAGSGFIFWNRAGAYRARTFTGRLEPLAALPFAVSHASFGPGFALLRGSEGSMRVLDLQTGKLRGPKPLGLIDVAAAADGRVVSALELGRYGVSLDRNATLREVQDELGMPVQSLSSDPLGFVLENGALVTLSSKGELLNRGTPSRAKPAALWPAGESALEQAVAFGVSRGARALVAQAAALAEVDLQSGELLRVGAQLLPGAPDCRLLEQGGELLMKCLTRDSLAVLGQLEGERAVLEQTFERSAQIVSAFGYLLVDRDCNGQARPYTVCVRERGGSWRTVTGNERKSTGPAPAITPVVLGYGFKADGNVVAFVRGAKTWYQDLGNDQTVELEGNLTLEPAEQAACRIEKDGLLRCLAPDGPAWFGPDGKLRPSPLDFTWVAGAGEHALGFDHAGKLFQSDDWGKTWVEVALPPQMDQRIDRNARCSAVGCRFGGWLRMGWEAVSPETRRTPETVALPNLLEPARRALACSGQAEPKLQVARPLVEGEPRGFGVEVVPAGRFVMNLETTAPTQTSLGAFGLRGMISGAAPRASTDTSLEQFWIAGEGLRFRFVDYFDTKPSKAQATLSLSAWLRSFSLVGSAQPSFSFEDQLTFQGVPVLSPEIGKAAGMIVMLEQSPVWVTANKALPLALERSTGSESVNGAIAEKSGALVLLLDDGSVVRYAQGSTTRLFQVPANLGTANVQAHPDALAITPQGEVAVLRFSGSDAPNAEYPVLVYRPGKAPEALAPFASLGAAGSPGCATPSGYRAIVLANQSWLKLLRGAGQTIDDDWGLTALVSWSAERVCVEALELADASFVVGDQALLTRVAAVFGPKPSAVRLGFGPGVELRQPLTCELRH